MPKRAMIFVDGNNLFHGAKEYDESFEYDFVSLREELANGYDLIRSYWFQSFPPNDKPEGFFRALELNGYRVISKPLRQRDGNWTEKGTDIALATEMLTRGYEDSYDVAVLVSGDDDYSRAVEVVEDHGKQVTVAMFRPNLSDNLQRTADEVVILDDIASRISR